MDVTLVQGNQLTDEQIGTWVNFVETNPSLSSPYFRPEFTQAVAAERPDVEVAILRETGEIRGFFPFQRRWKRLGLPVGEPLSDFQGIIGPADLAFAPRQIIRDSGLMTWRFNHLVTEQTQFQPFHETVSPSLFIDLSTRFDTYENNRRQKGAKFLRQLRRKRRKATKDIGSVRFEFHTTDENVFATLLRWKASQYIRTKQSNILAFDWIVNVLRRIWKHEAEGFSGKLSSLYLGNRLAAVDFSMRSHTVLHQWFPAYDINLARYSPGTICTLGVIENAHQHGIRRIDFGTGNESHKKHWTSESTDVAEGTVTSGRRVQALCSTYNGVRATMHHPVIGAPLRLTARATRSLRRSLLYRS